MVALSPALSLIAALIAAPLVIVTRAVQVRVRQAERESRVAVGAVNTRLQEDLRGIEVIRAFGREPEFVAGFRQVLSRGLAASNRSLFYSALYTPMTAILSAIAVAALLAAGTQQAFGAASISLGTLTAFLLLLQRFFQPITALGEEWQTVQGAMAGAERIFDTLALRPDEVQVRSGLGRPCAARRGRSCSVTSTSATRRAAGPARSVAAGEGRRACRAGGADGRREDQRATSDRGPLPAVGGPRPRGRPRPRAARRSRAQPRAGCGPPGGPAVLGDGVRQPDPGRQVGRRGGGVRSGDDRRGRCVHPRVAPGLPHAAQRGRERSRGASVCRAATAPGPRARAGPPAGRVAPGRGDRGHRQCQRRGVPRGASRTRAPARLRRW